MNTIVVGAGIAGLWIAEQLAKRGDTVTILEKADYIGGRILTSLLGFEIGAGRIATNHRHFLSLVKRFGLTTIPIPGGELWKGLDDAVPRPNLFEETWVPIVKLIAKMDQKTLATHTLRELAEQTIGPDLTARILIQFGFRAETEVLRADLGLHAFGHEMGTAADFVIVKGGLSQITDRLADACKAAGVNIILNTKVLDLTATSNQRWRLHTDTGHREADRVILAIPAAALKGLSILKDFGPLKHLTMEPLTRIYAKFATAWPFKKKVITDSPLRFIIPIIPELGVVMISYTEAQDTRHFKGLTGLELVTSLQSEVWRLFPNQSIPILLWAHAYEWGNGCTYWLPGNYDAKKESQRALTVRKYLHICGESFSLRLAWVVGAMEHASALLAVLTKPVANVGLLDG